MSSSNRSFTPAMRDLQARGKDPYAKPRQDSRTSTSANASGSSSKNPIVLDAHEPVHESFEQREKRQMAMAILDSPEMLMQLAMSEGDSVAGQRQRFIGMLCGMDEPPILSEASSSRRTPRKKD